MDGHLDVHAMHTVPLAMTASLSTSETDCQHARPDEDDTFYKTQYQKNLGGHNALPSSSVRNLGGFVPRVPRGIYAYDSPPINSQCTNFVLFDVAL